MRDYVCLHCAGLHIWYARGHSRFTGIIILSLTKPSNFYALSSEVLFWCCAGLIAGSEAWQASPPQKPFSAVSYRGLAQGHTVLCITCSTVLSPPKFNAAAVSMHHCKWFLNWHVRRQQALSPAIHGRAQCADYNTVHAEACHIGRPQHVQRSKHGRRPYLLVITKFTMVIKWLVYHAT